MQIFYQPDDQVSILTGTEAQHCTKVLRLSVGEDFIVVNGRGRMVSATILEINKDRVVYSRQQDLVVLKRNYRIHMAIAPTRKVERNEWMVEKMVELGVDAISFLKTDHSHQESFKRVVNMERMEKIAVSAMKQSRQSTLPLMRIVEDFEEFIGTCKEEERFVAYVSEDAPPQHLLKLSTRGDVVVLIGPEGDFSKEEILFALDHGFLGVSLGPTRLRTETAAVAACHAVHLART